MFSEYGKCLSVEIALLARWVPAPLFGSAKGPEIDFVGRRLAIVLDQSVVTVAHQEQPTEMMMTVAVAAAAAT